MVGKRKKPDLTFYRRDAADRRFKKWKPAAGDKPPKHGWLREIRQMLGMTSKQMGRMLGKSKQSVAALERAEVSGNARIKTLRKAAKLMNCDLVYALVPRKPIEKILRDRAFGQLMPTVVLGYKKMGIDANTTQIIHIVHGLIDQRKMLENPRALWEPPRQFKEVEDFIANIVSSYAEMQAAFKPKPPAEPSVPSRPFVPQYPGDEPPAPERMPTEEEIAQMPPDIQELARMGKVRV